MASVSAEAIINLNVRNQASLQRTLNTTQKLNSLIRQLKPINLLAPGSGAGADTIRKNMKIIQARAKAVSLDVKQLSATFAGAAGQASAFSDVLKNVKIKKLEQGKTLLESQNTSVQELAISFVRAEAKAEDLQERFEELVRSAKIAEGLAAGPATQLDSIEAKTKKRAYYENQITEEKEKQDKLDRKASRRERTAKKTTGGGIRGLASSRLFQDIATGGGFPLLMGGGPLSTIGGLLGGGFAGLGGSIVGSAIGQSIERAANAANQFALEVTKASTSIDTLVQKFGIVGTASAGAFRFAEELGIGGAARSAAEGSLVAIVGKDGLKNLELLGRSAEDASNALSRFGASATATLAPLLTAVNNLIAGLFGGVSKLEELERLRGELAKGARPVVSGPGSEARAQFEASRTGVLRQRIQKLEQDPEVQAQLRLEEQINKVIKDRKNLAQDSARLEQNRLSLRRDSLASEKGNLEVQALQNKLAVLKVQLEGKITDEKRRQLELDRDLTEIAKQQAEAARRNAVEEARRAIQKEQISSAASRLSSLKEIERLELSILQNNKGRFALFTEELDLLSSSFDVNKGILDLQRKNALIGVNEVERITAINHEYDIQERILERQLKVQAQSLRQANAAYKLSRLQVEQARELERIQAGVSAQQQIRQTSPFEQGLAFADPFFGGSRQLQAEQALRYSENLGLLQARLKQVTDQQQIFALAPGVREGLEDQQKAIEGQIANFEKYQPAVDAAALAQSRFSEAMALTVPVTNSLFENLTGLVEGTKTAEQAFADFLRTISDMLLKTAQQMIAQYIALGIARSFGLGGGATAPAGIPQILGQLAGRANGGPVTGGTPYVVGERGPELFVPRSSGTVVPNDKMGGVTVGSINISVENSGDSLSPAAQKQIAGQVQGIVLSTLANERRSGGML